MSAIRRCALLAAPILLALASSPAHAQDQGAALADRLRWFNYALDYSGGVAAARASARELRTPRARAWYALLLARDDEGAAALALADSLMAADRRSPWSWFARAAALGYGQSDSSAAALTASEEMYRLAPRDPDAVWLRVATLMNNSQSSEAIAIADSFLARNPRSGRHLVVRANATWTVANNSRPPNRALLDSAEALWTRARSLDSTNILAWAAPGSRLLGAGRIDEGVALLRRAAELAPLSPGVNRDYWRALRTLHVRDLEPARAAARPGLDRILAARGSDPAVLNIIAAEYREFGMRDEERAIDERALRDHPTSVAAEWVLVKRHRAVYTAMRDTTVRDTSLKSTYRRLLQEFVARPVHAREMLLGDAYRELFMNADSTTHPDTLLSYILGMERYEGLNPQLTFARGAIALADRRAHFDQAERLARAGPAAGRRRLEPQRASQGIGEYARVLDWMNSIMTDALGWVYFRAGRLEEAERELRAALEQDPKNFTALHHLGQFFEASNRPDSAEVYYIKGAMVPTPAANPNREALRTLQRTRRGSLDGFDAYYAGIRDQDRARRRTAIEAERLTARDSLPGFTLIGLAGDTVRSGTLRGRVTVINFWGKWCGPCVAEMPEMQRFWRQVSADTLVRFLTINNDRNLQELREWMTQNRYDIPALVDGGYAARAGVNLYPTTWFLDRTGRIAFVKAGWSEELAEEFGWRVEILMGEQSVP